MLHFINACQYALVIFAITNDIITLTITLCFWILTLP